MKQVVLFGFVSVISYLIYLAVMYFSVQQIKFTYAVTLSLGVWAISDFYVFYLAKKYITV